MLGATSPTLFPVGNNAKVLLTVQRAFYQKSFAAAVPLHPFEALPTVLVGERGNAAFVIWGGRSG